MLMANYCFSDQTWNSISSRGAQGLIAETIKKSHQNVSSWHNTESVYTQNYSDL